MYRSAAHCVNLKSLCWKARFVPAWLFVLKIFFDTRPKSTKFAQAIWCNQCRHHWKISMEARSCLCSVFDTTISQTFTVVQSVLTLRPNESFELFMFFLWCNHFILCIIFFWLLYLSRINIKEPSTAVRFEMALILFIASSKSETINCD